MFWIIIIALVIVVGYFMSKSHSEANEKTPATSTPAASWKKPVTPEEHLQFFAIMGEMLSRSSELIKLSVTWTYGPNQPDKVSMKLWNIDDTTIHHGTEKGNYLLSLSRDGEHATCSFEFPLSAGGAPYYFRDDEVLKYISNYAPHATLNDWGNTSDTVFIRFNKHY